jgi:NADPH2:quinone reductase
MEQTSMRAVVLREFGPPERLNLAEVPDPVTGPGQALIEVEAVNLTFVETQLRAGRPPHAAMAPQLPVILGNGVGGIVRMVGEGVDESLVGTRVISSTGGSGGYAEFVAVPASSVITVPDGLGTREAVALLADGRTALALIQAAEVTAGETVLVEAAAGGVGSLLVQLARQRGAQVVAVAGGQRKVRIALELGATVAVDYADPAWTDSVRSEVGGVDVVFDGVGGLIGKAAFELVRPGGRFCAFGAASGTFADIVAEDAARRKVTVVRSLPLAPADLVRLAQAALVEAAAGRLRPLIGQTFRLEDAAAAHAAMEARETAGKTLLLTGRPAMTRPAAVRGDVTDD